MTIMRMTSPEMRQPSVHDHYENDYESISLVRKQKQNLHCVDNLELKVRVASGDVVLFVNMFIGGGRQSSLGMVGTIGLVTVLNGGSR